MKIAILKLILLKTRLQFNLIIFPCRVFNSSSEGFVDFACWQEYYVLLTALNISMLASAFGLTLLFYDRV